jgi:hydroxypyruvate reductase
MSTRHTLLELFDAALRAVDGRACVARFLRASPIPSRVALFAVGKAASSMARGAFDALGAGIESALVITKAGHGDPALAGEQRCTVVESAHPVPDERSLAAGAMFESRVAQLPAHVMPLLLVSGGSSSLVEAPRDGVTLEDLRALNTHGLAAGWDIATLNTRRRALSRLKGGGIATLLGDRRALALFVSDVPGNDPAVIGSGLLGAAPGRADAVERHVIASVDVAVDAVVDAGHARGLELEARRPRFDGDAAQLARTFVAALRETSAHGLVWGGESTVTLPALHGRGGRNTHLALAAARALRPDEGCTILAAGTDGTDGPTEDAGAIVDAGSIGRAQIAGVDAERAFRACDSGAALEAAGDLIHTGPTGTNVGDILIGIRHSATSVRDAARGRVL